MSHLCQRLRLRELLGRMLLRRVLRLCGRWEGTARDIALQLAVTMRELLLLWLRHRGSLRNYYRTLMRVLMRGSLISIVMLCVVVVSSQGYSILLSILQSVDDPCQLVANPLFMLLFIIFIAPVEYFVVFLHDLQVGERM